MEPVELGTPEDPIEDAEGAVKELRAALASGGILRKVDLPGRAVTPGDVVEVGGLLLRVRDVRELHGRRTRLEFEDGNAYVLEADMVITVARAYEIRGAAVHPCGDVGRAAGSTTLKEDFG